LTLIVGFWMQIAFLLILSPTFNHAFLCGWHRILLYTLAAGLGSHRQRNYYIVALAATYAGRKVYIVKASETGE
jgi:hypothetical protein